MEKSIKPENLFIRRNRALIAAAAIIQFAFAAALIIAFTVAVTKNPIEEQPIFVLLVICVVLLSVAVLLTFALNLRNIFFPYLLTANEKGIYNYSGFFHFGFIAWEDIQGFTQDATLLDLLADEMPSLKIYLKNFKAYKSTLPFYKKWQLFWSGGEIKIYTLCSQIKRKQLYALLDEMLKYYSQPTNG